MGAGVQPTKQDLDRGIGSITTTIHDALLRAAELKYFLDGTPDANLVALGYTSSEVAVIKSAFTDLNHLNDIFNGVATQTPTYDFRTFVRQLWGTGGAI